MAKRVRNSGKAVIIRDGRLLAIRHIGSQGDWYSLPGGGQDPGETLIDALRRECMEELGVVVLPGRLRLVREYIGVNHEFPEQDAKFHKVDFIFECEFQGILARAVPTNPDERQVGVEWLPLSSLPQTAFYPQALRELLAKGIDDLPAVYLGDIN